MAMLLHSSAAYVLDPSRCLSSHLPSFRLTHTFNCSLYGTSLFGYAGVDEARRSLVFSFQGSMSVAQLWQELMHDQPVNASLDGQLLVNEYFLDGATLLLPAVSAAYRNLTSRYGDYTAHFTGHSLGGALAHVVSYLLLTNSSLSPPPLLYTFGQPRTGNALFAATSSLYLPAHFRVVHWRDAIPHLPPCPTRRGPGGVTVCSDSNATASYYAYHAALEVWYTSAMPALALDTSQRQQRQVPLRSGLRRMAAPPPPPPPPPAAWTSCAGQPWGEDEACSDGLSYWWLSDHYYYYQIEVGDFCLASKADGGRQPLGRPATS